MARHRTRRPRTPPPPPPMPETVPELQAMVQAFLDAQTAQREKKTRWMAIWREKRRVARILAAAAPAPTPSDGVALTSMAHPPGLIDTIAGAIRDGKLHQ